MKPKALLILSASLICLSMSQSSVAAPTTFSPLWLVGQSQSETPAPKLGKGILVNCVFGNTGSIVVQDSAGKDSTLVVNANTVFMNDGTTGSLTKMAQTEMKKSIRWIQQKVNGIQTALRVWDEQSYTTWVSAHQGSRNGQVKGLYPKVLMLGEHFYNIDDNTKFIVAGKEVARKKLEGMGTLWVKCTVKNGVATADVIADTSASLGVQTGSSGSTRPNSGRPPSTGGAVGGSSTGTSPTERTNGGRPASTGDGSKSPTERARTMTDSEKRTMAQNGYKVKVTLQFLDTFDGPTGNVVGQVANAVADELGKDDKTVEVFGSVMLAGQTAWVGTRDKAGDAKFKKGDKISCKSNGSTTFTIKGTTMNLNVDIKDRDQYSEDDVLLKHNENFDLYKLWQDQKIVVKPKNSKIQITIEIVN